MDIWRKLERSWKEREERERWGSGESWGGVGEKEKREKDGDLEKAGAELEKTRREKKMGIWRKMEQSLRERE